MLVVFSCGGECMLYDELKSLYSAEWTLNDFWWSSPQTPLEGSIGGTIALIDSNLKYFGLYIKDVAELDE